MKRIILLLLVAMLCLALCACGEDKLQASNPDVDMPTSGKRRIGISIQW